MKEKKKKAHNTCRKTCIITKTFSVVGHKIVIYENKMKKNYILLHYKILYVNKMTLLIFTRYIRLCIYIYILNLNFVFFLFFYILNLTFIVSETG